MDGADVRVIRRLSRDIYVAAGDVGFWQGALRDADDPLVGTVQKAIDERGTLTLDLEYGDSDGGQRTITRFMLVSHGDGRWLASAGRHWHLDRDDPR